MEAENWLRRIKIYLWWGRRYRTSNGSTTIGANRSPPSSNSSGCHSTRGSTPGGRGSLSSKASFSATLGTFKRLWISTKAGLEEPQGTNLFRAQSRRISSSFWSLLYPLEHGGLKGFRATAAPSDTESTRGRRGCLLTTRFPLSNHT